MKSLIEKEALKNITVENGFIEDIDRLYRSSHAVILPGLVPHSFKPSPHSVLESLSHGKPVLISRPSSISDIIEKEHCGVVFEPEVDLLVKAIDHLKENYSSFQNNCHKTANNYFSKKIFLEKYDQIYMD